MLLVGESKRSRTLSAAVGAIAVLLAGDRPAHAGGCPGPGVDLDNSPPSCTKKVATKDQGVSNLCWAYSWTSMYDSWRACVKGDTDGFETSPLPIGVQHGNTGDYPETAQKLFQGSDGTCKACDHTKVQGLVSSSLKKYWDDVHSYVKQQTAVQAYSHSRDWGEAFSGKRDEISSDGTYSYSALANECQKFLNAHPGTNGGDVSSCRDAQAAKDAISEKVHEKFSSINCAHCMSEKYHVDDSVGQDLADSMSDIWKVMQAPNYMAFMNQIIKRYCDANMKPMPCPPPLHSRESCEGDENSKNCLSHALTALQGKQPVTMTICVGQITGRMVPDDKGFPSIPSCDDHEVMMTAMGTAKMPSDKEARCYVRIRNSWGTGKFNCPYYSPPPDPDKSDEVKITRERCESDGSFLVPVEDLQKNLKDISYFGS